MYITTKFKGSSFKILKIWPLFTKSRFRPSSITSSSPLEMRVSMTNSVHSFVHDPHATISNKETFIRDCETCYLIKVERMFPRYNMHSDKFSMFCSNHVPVLFIFHTPGFFRFSLEFILNKHVFVLVVVYWIINKRQYDVIITNPHK